MKSFDIIALLLAAIGLLAIAGVILRAPFRPGSQIQGQLITYSLRGGAIAVCLAAIEVFIIGNRKMGMRADIWLIRDVSVVFLVGAGCGVVLLGARHIFARCADDSDA